MTPLASLIGFFVKYKTVDENGGDAEVRRVEGVRFNDGAVRY